MSKTLPKPPIVVFGGSFNPPTVAHVMAVAYILSRVDWLDLRVMPVYDHAHGKELLSFAKRLKLTRQAMDIFGGNVLVSSFEAVHKPKNTLEMVLQLKKLNPDREVTLVIGADCYRDRATWHRWDLLEKEVSFAVIGRGGVDLDDPKLLMPITLPEISSTDVRERAAKSDATIRHLLPSGVFDQIRREKLYGYDYTVEKWEEDEDEAA